MKYKFIPKPIKMILRYIINLPVKLKLKALDKDSIVLKIRKKNLTYLSDKKLITILESLKKDFQLANLKIL